MGIKRILRELEIRVCAVADTDLPNTEHLRFLIQLEHEASRKSALSFEWNTTRKLGLRAQVRDVFTKGKAASNLPSSITSQVSLPYHTGAMLF